MSTVSGHLLYYVCSVWSSPVVCPQSLVISCICLQSLVISCSMSAVSGHLLYYVCSLCHLLSCLHCISCTMSAVTGHLLYYVCSHWSSPVLCLQSLVLYYVCSPLVQNIFFSCFPPL
ncbi:unnamed protein product, partial [Staurois parvus]